MSTEGIERPEHAIFPNPTNGLLQVLNCENGMANIIAGNGVVVKSSFIQGGILDISELPCGLYQIQIVSKDNTFTKLIAKF
jgi:Secretion system C-terminal sorting domain